MIELQSIYDAYKVRAAGQGKTVRRSEQTARTAAAAPAQNQDSIQISPDAALRAELNKTIKTSAQQLDTTSPERMAYLKTKYAGDACPVSAEDVADAMLSRLESPQ